MNHISPGYAKSAPSVSRIGLTKNGMVSLMADGILPTILTVDQIRNLEDLALRVKGTDDPAALEIVAEDLADAILDATGWNGRMAIEHAASTREGRPVNWEAVNLS